MVLVRRHPDLAGGWLRMHLGLSHVAGLQLLHDAAGMGLLHRSTTAWDPMLARWRCTDRGAGMAAWLQHFDTPAPAEPVTWEEGRTTV